MGGFCSRKTLIYASSINTENISDLTQNASVSLGTKEKLNLKEATNENEDLTSSDVSDDEQDSEGSQIVATPKTREEMVSYWKEHSQSNLNKSLMLLMEDNPSFEEAEREEIVTYLPNFENMDCIELGAGIGRFTDELGKGKCKSLIAIDFVEKFIRENEKQHKQKYKNLGIDMKFQCQDVTTLVIKDLSFGFVFSNWLMMYLDDHEVYKLAEKMYRWCQYGGFIFFRESCEGGASGDKPRTNNPTYYRKHEDYTKLFDNVANKIENNNNRGGLKRISINKVKIYVDLKNKTNQYCWLYQKLPLTQ